MSFNTQPHIPYTMLTLYPNPKINLGLRVVSRRDDGYHNIETIMYPLLHTDWLDRLDIERSDRFAFTQSGITVDCDEEHNLVVRAYRLLEHDYSLPPVHIHLNKHIPFGAGLGGGSADAAFTLRAVNTLFDLRLTDTQLALYALRLGADCPFFIYNTPCLATGIGDKLEPLTIDLSDYDIRLDKPATGVSTAEAYRGITPKTHSTPLTTLIQQPVEQWAQTITNDFETTVFALHPEIQAIKERMYNDGAAFALMSGSGSSVFGLFKKNS